MNSLTKIGIDIGGVIIAQDTDEPDLFFTNSFLNANPFTNCFEIIKKLINFYGKENIFIISKCGEKVQKKSLEWLEHKNFFSFTGFLSSNIYFCLERHEKASIAEKLNISVFIDDRYTVLKHMLISTQLQRLILFCPSESELELSLKNPNDKLLKLDTWEEVGKILGVISS
jgi:hypothetical protein